jgi:hypothetical protein
MTSSRLSKKFKVPAAERADLFAIVDSTKKDIVLSKK